MRTSTIKRVCYIFGKIPNSQVFGKERWALSRERNWMLISTKTMLHVGQMAQAFNNYKDNAYKNACVCEGKTALREQRLLLKVWSSFLTIATT